MGTFIGESPATKNVLDVVQATWDTASSVPILMGPPGIGKTALVRALAEQMDLPLYILLGSTMDPTDVAGLPAVKVVKVHTADGTETDATITENTLNYWSHELISSGRGILFFDELTTTTPAVQAALLSLLQGRMVGRHRIPDTVHFIAAANPPEQAADGFELAPPMANRLLHIEFQPDNNDYLAGMSVAWNKEDVTARELDERGRIVAFLRNYPTLMNQMPTEVSEQGKAWPSYRSWDNLSRILSKLDSKAARRLATEGLVGEAALNQFTLFEEALKLPKYEDVLRAPEKINWKGLNPAETYVTLNAVLSRMNTENVADSCEVFKVALEIGKREDVTASLAIPIIRRVKQHYEGDKIGYTKLIGGVLKVLGPYLKDSQLK